jgi:hypothetical protein
LLKFFTSQAIFARYENLNFIHTKIILRLCLEPLKVAPDDRAASVNGFKVGGESCGNNCWDGKHDHSPWHRQGFCFRVSIAVKENELMKGEYDEAYQLQYYIWRNYRHALTNREHALYHAALLELNARHARSEDLAVRLREIPGYFFNAEVAAIAETGLVAFERQCCERLLTDYADQIYINRCECCKRIVVSPIACVCMWCGHEWYERRSEMFARAASSIYPTGKARE